MNCDKTSSGPEIRFPVSLHVKEEAVKQRMDLLEQDDSFHFRL